MTEVKLHDYKAGHQNNIVINDNSICIPLFGKEKLGEFFKEIIRKIPLNPFYKGGALKGIKVHFFIKKAIYKKTLSMERSGRENCSAYLFRPL